MSEKKQLNFWQKRQSPQSFKQDVIRRFAKKKGIGPKVAETVYGWFRDKKKQSFSGKLLKRIEILLPKPSKLLENSKIKGKKFFVLTGTMESISRDKAKEEIKLRAQTSESISGMTDFWWRCRAGLKIRKAKELG